MKLNCNGIGLLPLPRGRSTLLVVAGLFAWTTPGGAQEVPNEEAALSVAHAALRAISEEDPVGLTDLMIQGATVPIKNQFIGDQDD